MMLMTNAKRIMLSGYRSFMRSGFTSIASILMMVVTLFVIISLIFVQVALTNSLKNVKEKVDVTVYFTSGAAENEINTISQALKKLPEVESVKYTSAEEALTLFKDKHSSDYLTLQALDELPSNPLGASLSIKARETAQYESISKYFESDSSLSKGALTIIDKVDYHQNKVVIDRLTSIISGAKKLGFAVSMILILISIIITFSTMRLIIYMSREEISVMRLVGAGFEYIGGPFMVTGMLVGVAGALTTVAIFLPVSIWLGNQMTDFLGINLFDYYKSNFFELLALSILSGIILGSISSIFAIIKYLRK